MSEVSRIVSLVMRYVVILDYVLPGNDTWVRRVGYVDAKKIRNDVDDRRTLDVINKLVLYKPILIYWIRQHVDVVDVLYEIPEGVIRKSTVVDVVDRYEPMVL